MNNSTETIELDKLLSGEIKTIELDSSQPINEASLNTMTIKQLRDLAKANKIKSSGNKTKPELIALLSKL